MYARSSKKGSTRSAPASPYKTISISSSQSGESNDGDLVQKIVLLSERLDEEREVRQELERAKQVLLMEVEELSKSLFEEAGSMVATEAKKRAELETLKARLERDLTETKEQLAHQTEQLQELRARLLSVSRDECAQDPPMVSHQRSPSLDPHIAHPLNHLALHSVRHYAEVLFPDGKFSTRRHSQHHPGLWQPFLDQIQGADSLLGDPIHGGSVLAFDEFKGFVDVALHSAQSFQAHAYFKKVERLLEACLWFEAKTSNFPKRVVASMLHNECVIERILNANCDYPAGTPTDTFFNRLTTSVTSLSDTLFDTDPKAAAQSAASSPKKKLHPCTLCGSPIPAAAPRWRLRLSPAETHWRLADDACRDRLVAVGDYIAFIRHLRAGLFSARPVVDLWAEQLHLVRNVFYTAFGSLAFFVLSDFEQFWRRCRSARVQHDHAAPPPQQHDDADINALGALCENE